MNYGKAEFGKTIDPDASGRHLPKEIRPIPERFGRLQEALTELELAANSLVTECEPILRPAPTEACGTGSIGDPSPPQSHVADSIQDAISRVQYATDILNGIRSRIEV